MAATSSNPQSALERAVRVELGARILSETLLLCGARLELFECEFKDELINMPTSLTKCSSWAQQLADLAHASLDGLADESFWDEGNRDTLVSLRKLLADLVISIRDDLGIVGARISGAPSADECAARMQRAANDAARVHGQLSSLQRQAEQVHELAFTRLQALRQSPN